MRPRVEGMNELDDAILEFFELQDQQICLPPTVVHYNLAEVYGATDKTRPTVSRRMSKLERRGLLERVDDGKGYYQMTENGRDYLSGDIAIEELRLPDDP